MYTIKTLSLLLLLVCAILPQANAQQSAFDEFRKAAGDHAALYIGEIETGYSSQQYINHPYWDTNEFREGKVCYEGNLYTHLQLRYDVYKKNLVVITPERQIGILVDMRKIHYFFIGDQKFVPQSNGFGQLLYESPQMQFTQQMSCTMGVPVEKNWISYSNFRQSTYFNLCKDGTDYTIKNRSDLLKLFPTYKKQLKKYAKERQLDFIDNRAEALSALTEYVDSLIKKEQL